MAHYALLNNENIVVNVITGVDEDTVQTDLDGTQVGGSTEAWEAFYASRPWFDGLTCKRTSYHGRIRKNYAGVGFTYDPVRDAFIPPRPVWQSWVLNEETCQWEAPTPMPDDGNIYQWDEETLSWVEVEPLT